MLTRFKDEDKDSPDSPRDICPNIGVVHRKWDLPRGIDLDEEVVWAEGQVTGLILVVSSEMSSVD
jgi:hypothetical protein